ncbi:putative ribonuclease H-like domain-containing protein [Tanacetum coccineum]
MVPRTVFTGSGPISLNAARLVNTVQPRTAVNNAGPMKNVINNAYSTARRPFNKITAANNSNFNKRVNIVNDKNVNAARPNAVVNTARPKVVISAIKGNKGNAVKASACWGNPQQDLKDKGVIDSGCSRHMTGNRSYLTDYEEIDGGFVAFRGNSKGGKITGKGKKACVMLNSKDSSDVGFKPSGDEEKKDAKDPGNEDNNVVAENIVYGCADDPNMPELEEIGRFSDVEDDILGADMNNLDTYFQMDVKSDFLYGKIEEEVYVCQPLGFEDQDFPDRVYKVEKALYGLHQAPRTWYETLSTYLLDNGFQRGKIDKTLFIRRDKGDILLVQVYVDDIIFGSTKKSLCTEFEKMMHKKFQMSSMGELTFFLGLQVKQKEDGIFINGKDVDEHLYRSMIGSLMYLTSLRPDIMFAECACERFQVNYKVSHLHAVKRIFRYLKDRKSTTKGRQFLGCRLISWQCKKQTVVATSTTEAEYIAASNCCGQIQALVDKKKVIITETSIRSDLQLEDAKGTECLPNATIFEQLTLMGYENLTQKLTFYKAFFSPQWKFIIHTILQCLSAKTAAWNEFSSTMASAVICLATNKKFNFSKYIFDNMVKNLEGGVKFLMCPRQGKDFFGRDTPLFPTMIVQAQEQKKQSRRKQRKDTKDHQLSGPTEPVTDDTKNVASVPTHSNDPLLSGEDRLKLTELMQLYTKLSKRVLALETTKTSQAAEVTELKKRVKELEGKRKSKPPGIKRLFKIGRPARVVSSEDKGLGDQKDASKQGRKIVDIDADAEVTLVDETQGRNDEGIFDTSILDGEEVFIEQHVVEKKKDQIMFDKKVAQKLQAQLDAELEEEDKLARQREEDANIAEWDNVQAMMDADYELAARLQAEKQGELTIEEKSRLLHGYKSCKWHEQETEESSKSAREKLEYKNLKKQKKVKYEESTRTQRRTVWKLFSSVSTFCEISESAYLYAGRKEISSHTCNNHRNAQQEASS